MADIEAELLKRLEPLVSFALATYPDLREKYVGMYASSVMFQAKRDEAEECAKVVDGFRGKDGSGCSSEIAAAIRARGYK